MRKLIAVLAILVSSLGFIGATPAVSSAASCQFFMGTTVWTGQYLAFGEQFNNCSRVDMVQFERYHDGGSWAGWTDVSNGTWQIAPSSLNVEVVGFGRPGIVATANGWTWYHASWCGGFTHTVKTSSLYQIHNMDTNTWGTWHLMTTTNYAIVC